MKKLLSILGVSMMLTGCSQYALVNSDVYNGADLADYHTFRIVTPADGKLPPGMEMVTYYNIAAAIREQLVERGYTEDPASPILVNIGLTVNKQVSAQAVTTPPVPYYPGPGPMVPPPYPCPQAPEVPEYNVMAGQGPGLAVPPGGEKNADGQIVVPTPNPNDGLGATPVAQARPQPGPGTPPPPGPVYNGCVPWFVYPRAYYWPQTTQITTSVYREGVLTMDIVDMQTKMPLYSSSVATILDNGDTQLRNLQGIAQAVKVLFSKFPVPLLPQYR